MDNRRAPTERQPRERNPEDLRIEVVQGVDRVIDYTRLIIACSIDVYISKRSLMDVVSGSGQGNTRGRFITPQRSEMSIGR